MIVCPKYSGHAVSSTLKATTLTIALYIRTIRVPFFSSKMVAHPAVNRLDTSIYYYFVTDRANCGEIKIKHCPTVEMVGDFFTKPLQGGLLIKFRDRILNTQNDPSTVPIEDHSSLLGRDHSHATGQS